MAMQRQYDNAVFTLDWSLYMHFNQNMWVACTLGKLADIIEKNKNSGNINKTVTVAHDSQSTW